MDVLHIVDKSTGSGKHNEFRECFKKTTAMFLICVVLILGISFNMWFVHDQVHIKYWNFV